MTTMKEVINHLLSVIGEDPVTSAESNHPSALIAKENINRVSKELQIQKWWFNTDYNLKLSPNGVGNILVPSRTLFIDPVDTRSNIVRRGDKMYNPIDHTFIFTSPIYVDVVLLLDIEEIPESAANYVQHKAALDMYVNEDGDQIKTSKLETRVESAWAIFREEYLRTSDFNAYNRPAVREVMYRSRMLGRTGNFIKDNT